MLLKETAKEEQQAPGVLEKCSVPSPQETLQQVTSVWWVYTSICAFSEEKHSHLGVRAAVC